MGWKFLVYMGRTIRKGLRLGFAFCVGTPMFWAVAPMRALTVGDVG